MELGMIGLGRMGANMTERLLGAGHRVVSYDRSWQAVESVVRKGAAGADSLKAMAVWLMVPAGDPVEQTIQALVPELKSGDAIVDGGNSYYKDTLRRSEALREAGLDYIDVGTSGGIWGLKEGYSLMVGGDEEVVERLKPIFQSLAPAPDKGWGRVGPCGAGHFVKMVHNGIEYGLMQAFAEGFALMEAKTDFKLDLDQIAEIWRHGSVVRSWLLDLIAAGLAENPGLRGIKPHVEDSGEGRWTVNEAVDLEIAAPIITLSLLQRFRSRDTDSFADKLLAMMRHEFGGHALKKD
jgi:6-phosphogluconate dehydrogenase